MKRGHHKGDYPRLIAGRVFHVSVSRAGMLGPAWKSRHWEDVLGSSAVIYLLVALSTGNLPSITGLAIYQDQASCAAAVETMTPALKSEDESVKLACVSSTDLNALAEASGF